MSALLKILIVLSLSSVKFLLAPPLSFSLGLNYLQTIFSTSLGGIMGVLFFFYLSKGLIRVYDLFIRKHVHTLVHSIAERLNAKHLVDRFFPLHRTNKVFTFRNRLIIRVRRKYGFLGIVILTPVLFSIPVGSFLIARFYSKKRYNVLYLSASVIIWSLLMSSAIAIF
jgi:hypothetical protein